MRVCILLTSLVLCSCTTGRASTGAVEPSAKPTQVSAQNPTWPHLDDDCKIVLAQNYPTESQQRHIDVPVAISESFSSWGSPVSTWTIERGGRGCLTKSGPAPPNWPTSRVSWSETFIVTPAEFDEIARLMQYERTKRQFSRCRTIVTDAGNGSVIWFGATGWNKVQFSGGDQCAGSDAYFATSQLVYAKVEALVAAAKANRTSVP
jgi:hypothetical protein